MRYDPLRYFYRFFAFVLFRQIFVSFNKEIPCQAFLKMSQNN